MNDMPPGLSFESLNRENLEFFLPHLLETESVFPEGMRETAESIRAAMSHDRAFGLLLFEGDDYVGNAIAFGIAGQPYEDLGIGVFRPVDPAVAYLFNIAIQPGHQGRGHGKRLLAGIRDQAAALGFTTLGGHFRDNLSLRNFQAIGGRELGIVEDWFGSGETYTYAELALRWLDQTLRDNPASRAESR